MNFDTRSDADLNGCTLATAGKAATLPATVIEPLLELLANDDAFRARFEANPREALREVGYETPAGCVGIRELDPVMAFDYLHGGLASKAKINAGRATWLAQLREKEQIFGPFSMCA